MTSDDGSCIYLVPGCMSDWADNYDELATEDDGTCYKEGCMWFQATNFDSEATTDNEKHVSEKVVCQIGQIIMIHISTLMPHFL